MDNYSDRIASLNKQLHDQGDVLYNLVEAHNHLVVTVEVVLDQAATVVATHMERIEALEALLYKLLMAFKDQGAS